jgi:hypothetical protein
MFLLNDYMRKEVVEASISENCLSRNGQGICSAAKNTNLRQPHLSTWCAKQLAQGRLMTTRKVIH